MKRFTWFLFPLFILILSYIVRNNIKSKQDIPTGVVERLQNQFDSLGDAITFSHQKVERVVVGGDKLLGRSSIHDFPTLGVKVYSDDPYSESFKTEFPFIIKNGNILIDKFSPMQYIEEIAKDPSKDMKAIYEEKYLKQFGTGCYTSIETGNLSYFTGNSSSNIDIYYAKSLSGGFVCYVGVIPNERYIQLWYNKNKPDRYYVVNLSVGCAPGKCNVFNSIELY